MTIHWRDRLILWAPLAVIAALLAAPAVEDTPTVCPFALCTGMACPGCGMTRAASRLIRGDLGGAIVFHPAIPLITVTAVGGWVWFLLVRAGTVRPPSRGFVNFVLSVISVALIGVWVARLLTGTLPDV